MEHSTQVVAAFDFGTTYSGYAFAFKDDPAVYINKSWTSGGSEVLLSNKTPTSVLLTPDKVFHSFGYKAENKYAELVEEKDTKGWLFFRNFKMLLHNKEKLSRDTIVRDINKKEMQAMDIFSMSIGYLRGMFLKEIESRSRDFHESTVLYVLTVPAMWAENAKQFMREAAIKAGIDTLRLKLVLEPEAAMLYCQQEDGRLVIPKRHFMVIDVGGGTADIGCYIKNSNGSLKQTYLATGGPWGGICVDENYIKALEFLFNKEVLDDCFKNHPDEYFDLLRGFETKKRSIGADINDAIAFRIPSSITNLNKVSTNPQTPEERFVSRYPGKRILLIGDKLKLDISVIRTWFDKPIDKLIKQINSILNQLKEAEETDLLLVGGFGECQYVQEKLQNEMEAKKIKVIVPKDANLAVLKGAVLYGFNPNSVSFRVMKYSYGIEAVRDFDKKKDAKDDIVVLNKKEKVDHIFIPFVQAGNTVKVGHKVKMDFKPTGEREILLQIYRTENQNVKLTTDCERIGTLTVLLPSGHKVKKFVVKMVFGQTELIVKAKLRKSEDEFHAVFDCLM